MIGIERTGFEGECFETRDGDNCESCIGELTEADMKMAFGEFDNSSKEQSDG